MTILFYGGKLILACKKADKLSPMSSLLGQQGLLKTLFAEVPVFFQLGIVAAALPLRSNGALLRGTAESPAVLLGRQLPVFFTDLQLYLLELIL